MLRLKTSPQKIYIFFQTNLVRKNNKNKLKIGSQKRKARKGVWCKFFFSLTDDELIKRPIYKKTYQTSSQTNVNADQKTEQF